ncbi:MAG: hypothetical protein IJC36_03965 [Clostridia bacterium]|nr:hypothetical protein [Clostridia bacterium]
MKKFLALTLSLLILVSTIVVGFTGITAFAEENTSVVDLNDASKWVPNPNKASMAVTNVTEDDFSALKAESADYQSMYVEVELKPSTAYSLLFDFKSSLKIEHLQIWPTKCEPVSSSDGSVTYDKENYTTADRILFTGGWDGTDNYSKNIGHTDPIAWYNGNSVDFVTNSTDTSYRIFFKMNGLVNSEVSTAKVAFFKNVAIKEKASASSEVRGNGSAAVSAEAGYVGDTVTYTSTSNEGEEFFGWYKGDTLVSAEPSYETTLVSGDNVLTARFTTNNLMNIALWGESPSRSSIQITEAIEDDFNTIKLYDLQYAYVLVDMELKPCTEYQISFDFKSAYKIECYEIWPTKCNCLPKSDGNVGPGEGYTTEDRIVQNFNLFSNKTDNTNWYEDNTISFTTNETDASYQLFFKFGGVTDAATNATKSVFVKNIKVLEKVTAAAVARGNGAATVSKTEGFYGDAVTYTASAYADEVFLGWYKGDVLVSNDAVYNTTLGSGENTLTAKFTTNNLMNIACWGESPKRASIQITEAIEDGYNAVKVYDIQYAYFYVNMELKPNTTYRLSYDFKTDYKPEYIDVWPAEYATAHSDGNVIAGEGHSAEDRILRKYLSSTDLDNKIWYENNVVEFTTNATDSSYQFFMKFGGFVNEEAKTTKSVYFKNFKVGEPVTALADSFGNGTATVSPAEGEVGETVTYTATPAEGENFVGWFNGSYELVSDSAEYSATLLSGKNDLTAYFTTNDNMNITSWHANPKRSDMKIGKANENGVDVISASSIYYNLYYFDVLLDPNTEYTFEFDFKSALKFENVQIWPLKCNPHAADNGTVTYDTENYTDADKILFKGGYDGNTNLSSMVGHTSYNTWYEGNRIAFTTNDTDSAYRVFFKMNGWVDSNTENQTPNAAYFKNVSVKKSYNQTVDFEIIGEDVEGNTLSASSEFSTAETIKTENEDGTITARVLYAVDEANMVIFKGWYEGDEFRSGSEAYTFDPTAINADNLVAKFISRNLLTGAGGFENHGAEKSLRVSPAGAGVLPEDEKWGMWSKWPTNDEVTGGYECESTNGSMVVTSGTQIGIKYLSNLDWVDETEQYISETATTTLDPLDGNKMLRISAPFRSAIRKIDNLKPNTNYTLSFYVWNPDRWNCLRTAVVADSTELETYIVKSTDTCKVYDSFNGMTPAKFLNDSGLNAEYPVREWQKITFNFTTDEDDEYLYLHLGLIRKDVASNSGFVYIDNLICYENLFETVGNAIRADDSALRFKYSVKNELLTDYYEGSSMNKIGFIATPTDLINGSVTVDGDYIFKDVTENNYQYVEGDTRSTYLTAALYNIGRIDGRMDYNRYAKDYTVRPYIVYEREDGTEFVLYGDAKTANIFDVMYTIKWSATSKTDMEIVDAMLDNEELYDIYQNYQDKNTFYIDKSNATDYAYSMAVLGDIQTTNYYYRDKLHFPFDWIIDNAEDKNIQYVFGLGDITDMSTDAEFTAAKEQLLRIKNAGIDQSITRGNHDWSYDNYITYSDFGDGLVSFDGTMRSYYRLTTIGGVKYMMLTLDLFPDDDIINWADEVIAAHPDYNVIVTTHGYFDGGMEIGDGNLLQDEDIQWVDNPETANSGQDLFDKLVNKHSNIVLLLCGHEIPVDHGPSYEITTREDGSKVVQMMVNHQHLEYYGGRSYGMLAMLYFSEDGKNVQLEYFSTVNEMYYMDKFQYEFQLDIK